MRLNTRQYVKQERAIARDDVLGMRDRWQYGLRLLRDPAAIADSGKSLQNHVAEQLIAAAAKAGLKLREREIQYRLQCARTYKTEAEFRNAIAEFGSWFALIQAGFPAYETDEDEPPADHRTDDEIFEAAKAELDRLDRQANGQYQLDITYGDLEPIKATLKDLSDYCDQQEQMTANFDARDKKKRAHLNDMLEASGDDASTIWADAERLLDADDYDLDE